MNDQLIENVVNTLSFMGYLYLGFIFLSFALFAWFFVKIIYKIIGDE